MKKITIYSKVIGRTIVKTFCKNCDTSLCRGFNKIPEKCPECNIALGINKGEWFLKLLGLPEKEIK